MDKKIAEIAKMILGCEDIPDGDCPFNRSIKPIDPQSKQICAECRAKAILALIEQEQKPMVEALKGIEERARLAKGKATGERPLKSATEACAWIAKEAAAVLPKGEGK